MEKTRDRFLVAQDPSYQHVAVHHPIWHCIYLGLAFQKDNPYGITFEDGVSVEKARSIRPDVKMFSSEHYSIIKDEFLKILMSDPIFVLKVMLMKCLYLAFMFVKYANFGLIFAFYVRPSWKFILPFLITISFYALPGVLVLPERHFVLGMICTPAFLGIYLIGKGLEIVSEEKAFQRAIKN